MTATASKRMTTAQKKAALRALDDISVSLADRGHTWSPFERRAYQKLLRLLKIGA